MKIKALVSNGLLLAVSIVASLAVAEFGTRLLYPALVPSGHLRFVAGTDAMPTLGPRNTRLRQIKNAGDFDILVTFNQYGLRDSKDLAESSPDDIFLVGDSLSFGWGVEENERYSDLVQAALKRPVFNLCIPGGLDEFDKVIAYAERNGAKVNNLLIAISMGSNLRDYDKGSEVKDSPTPLSDWFLAIKANLMTRSAFYFLVTSFVHKSETLKEIATDLGLINPNIEGIAHKPFSQKAIESTAHRAARLAREHNAVIVIAPSRALWFSTGEEWKTADRIHRAFTAELRSLGLEVIDPRPVFDAAESPLENYFPNDGHWSSAGHRAVAGAIVEHFETRRGAAAVLKPN